jgi:hypothetical protein
MILNFSSNAIQILTLEQALAVFDYDLLNTSGLNARIIGNALDDKCQKSTFIDKTNQWNLK